MSGVPTHGQSMTPGYRVWKEMIRRCHNPACAAYPAYGGRGIFVCDRWRGSLEAFLEDMGPKPSAVHEIDRRDNDGGYTPENCRWVRRKVNARNRRSNRVVSIGRTALSVAEWAERNGLKPSTIIKRLDAGWDAEMAVTTASRPKRRNGDAKPDKTPCMDCGTPSWGVRCKPCENRARTARPTKEN